MGNPQPGGGLGPGQSQTPINPSNDGSSSSRSSSSSSDSENDEGMGKGGDKGRRKGDHSGDDQGFCLRDLKIKRRRKDEDQPADAPKRPALTNPPTFDGSKDGKSSYRQWTKVLRHFLEYHIDTWRRERDMTMTVGSFMKDTARDWFDTRDEQMRKLRIVGNYRSFVESMGLFSKHDKEAQTAV